MIWYHTFRIDDYPVIFDDCINRMEDTVLSGDLEASDSFPVGSVESFGIKELYSYLAI